MKNPHNNPINQVTIAALATYTAVSVYQRGADPVTAIFDVAAQWLAHPPLPVLAALATIIGNVLWVSLRRGIMRPHKDPKRLFTPEERTTMFRNAGNQCEHKNMLWFRCRVRASHADHIYPHAWGGQTTLSNGQALCVKHNLRKSDAIPSWLYIKRLEHRRRSYYPAGTQTTVYWKNSRMQGQVTR